MYTRICIYIYTHLHSLVPVLRYSDTVQLMLLWKNRKRCRSMHACARLSPRFSLPGRFDTLVFFLPFFLFAPVDQLVSQRGGEGRGLEQERDKSFLSFSSVELSVSIFIFEKRERKEKLDVTTVNRRSFFFFLFYQINEFPQRRGKERKKMHRFVSQPSRPLSRAPPSLFR